MGRIKSSLLCPSTTFQEAETVKFAPSLPPDGKVAEGRDTFVFPRTGRNELTYALQTQSRSMEQPRQFPLHYSSCSASATES
jgi:hypothetical protein